MNDDLRQTIRKLQATLIRIDNGERFFFNITNYLNLGLIKARNIYANNAVGNRERIRTEYYLTDKAKQYIKVAVRLRYWLYKENKICVNFLVL